MQRTISEKLFEKFCATKGITCHRIPESDTRTPDYELLIEAERIIVEVKEITPNKAEQEADRLPAERGYSAAPTPGDRVRNKIADCSAQIKRRTKGKHASLLVLFEKERVFGHLDQYNIRVAMYGLEQIHIAVPPPGMGSPHSTGMSYGPKRKMTPHHNTSISAIGALFITGPAQVSLEVYHNKYARIPLKYALLDRYGVEQFELEGEMTGSTSKWSKIDL